MYDIIYIHIILQINIINLIYLFDNIYLCFFLPTRQRRILRQLAEAREELSPGTSCEAKATRCGAP